MIFSKNVYEELVVVRYSLLMKVSFAILIFLVGCNENATSSNDQYLTDPDISEQTKKPSRPIIDEKNKGVTDTSVTIEWDKIECEKNFSHYNVIVYRKDRIEDVITIRTRNNSVFIDDLKPNSQYSIDVSSCLHSACSESAKIEFITLN
ncbi:fibronectin type III domain-containing protein, partial [Vibrio cholerae]